MDYKYAWTRYDMKIIDKLNKLTNPETFYEDVRKLTKNIHTDHNISRWQCLSEIRYEEIKA